MGGAMDLVVGAKRNNRYGAYGKGSQDFRECTFLLTAVDIVDMIITDMGVIEVTDKGMELIEIAPGVTVEEVQAATGCELIISDNLKEINVA